MKTTLNTVIQFNPSERLKKGETCRKVAMEHVHVFSRSITEWENVTYNGGTKFRNGDTLLARITPCLENGKTAMVSFLNDGEVACGSTEFIVLRAIKGKTDPFFVYYLAISKLFRDLAIKSMVGSTGRQRVQQNVIENAIMEVPTLTEQEKIVAVLSALDSKIELNTQINQNLEQQIQAIFSHLINEAASFYSKLGDVCKCVLGGTPDRSKPEYWNGDIPWINSGKVNDFRITSPSELITEDGLKRSATKLLPSKTTVLAITGATLGQVSLLEISACANQSVIGVIGNERTPYTFIYPFIKAQIGELMAHQTGGAQQHINKQNVEDLPIPIYAQDKMAEYDTVARPLFDAISCNCFESLRLATLRDTLLPRLMSGEIDVSEVAV